MNKALRSLTVAWFSLLAATTLAADAKRNVEIRSSGGLERRIALVIGNDSYQHVGKLENARADARAIAKGLADTGFTVTLKIDVTEKAMKEAIRSFKGQVNGGDVAVFYYSGHGVQLGAANYLLPTDIRGDNEEQVKDEAVPLQRILDDLQDQKAKFSLAIIDACRNNPFKSSGRAIGGRGLAPTTAATGQMVLFSAGTGQQALDRVGPNDRSSNGLFTRVLLKEMERPGVPVDRVLRNVREEVVKIAKTVDHEQVPALYDQALGDFYFRPGQAAAVQTAAAASVAPTRVQSAAEQEQELWDSIKDSGSVEAFDEYLNQYPKGRFLPQAKVLLAKIKSSRPATTAAPASRPETAPAAAPIQTAMLTPSPAFPVASRPAAAPDSGFPSRPVRIVVPFAAGGLTDTVARVLAARIASLAGQPVVVENRPGAGGTIGGDAVAKAAPDGYTVLLGSSSTHAIGPSLYSRMPYNAQSDFAPVAYLADSPTVLVIHPSIPARSLAELLQQARSRPGQLAASPGTGTLAHLQAELLRSQAGVDIVHVPYKGVGPAMADLLGGQTHLMFADMASVLPHVRSGKLRALAFSGATRSPQLPEVPTLAESGFAGVAASTWAGLYAPAGTPPGIVARLNLLVFQALQDAGTAEKLSTLGFTPGRPSAPEQLGSIQRSDTQKWARVIQAAGIRLD